MPLTALWMNLQDGNDHAKRWRRIEVKGDQLITSNPAETRFATPPKGRKHNNGLVITTFEAMRTLIDAIDAYGDECIEKIT